MFWVITTHPQVGVAVCVSYNSVVVVVVVLRGLKMQWTQITFEFAAFHFVFL